MAVLSAYRFGLAPLRTSGELQQVLPVPVYLWVSGMVGLVYPSTTRANPSEAVGFVATRTLPSWVGQGSLPLYVNGRQWQGVVVPLLQDGRLSAWRGSLAARASSPVRVPVLTACEAEDTVVGAQSPTLEPGPGFLYGCDWTGGARPLGKSGEYLRLLTLLVGEYAEQAGYGTPLAG
jgi:hypothetical protein